jgi:hypothetical protein
VLDQFRSTLSEIVDFRRQQATQHSVLLQQPSLPLVHFIGNPKDSLVVRNSNSCIASPMVPQASAHQFASD